MDQESPSLPTTGDLEYGVTRGLQAAQGYAQRAIPGVVSNITQALGSGGKNLGSILTGRRLPGNIPAIPQSKTELLKAGLMLTPAGRVVQVVTSKWFRYLVIFLGLTLFMVMSDVVNRLNNPINFVQDAVGVTFGGKNYAQILGEESCKSAQERFGVKDLDCTDIAKKSDNAPSAD